MAAGTIATILAALKIFMLVLGEIFAARKRAREREEKWELDAEQYEKATVAVMARIRAAAAKENAGVGKVEDQLDMDLKP